MIRATPFLMFQGRCEEALRFYVQTLPETEIASIERFGEGEPGPVGTVRFARLRIGAQEIIANDSPPVHDFTFTPSFSLWIECDEAAEVDRLATALSDGGRQMMPADDYGFSRRFAFVEDRFGVSFQINAA
ncbi:MULTISPECIES: VOC family protein [Thalassobaculum]|uniref:Glyoxalase superfamily enzyme, possibly 3-demethylubiquinone-9 3-methyltransferase n=1 Tax=Thalassobaculum litoreum DSM 18839 TaxID=1123362 RepID=A0A8G2BLC8_9PROT|nr:MULTISPECIES: VOC family protein [Thalassobaculum]SDF94381.1 Glyoxalase superfamily enzyme, possibly 3-demethylubiquinone-9 3-methyltransferase [Thalassobaculum litoreum DSM 18839]